MIRYDLVAGVIVNRHRQTARDLHGSLVLLSILFYTEGQ
jgi:hypothetical protein